MTEKELTRGLLLRTVMLSIALLAVIFAFLAGWLPVRFLGLTLIATIVPFAVIFWRFIRRFSAECVTRNGPSAAAPPDEARCKRIRSHIRKFQIAAGAEAALLIYGYFATIGEPLLLRLANGLAIILMIYFFLYVAKCLQRQLS
jgi:hypothetical protein